MVVGEGSAADVLCVPRSQLAVFSKEIVASCALHVLVLEDVDDVEIAHGYACHPLMPLPHLAMRALASRIAFKNVVLLHDQWHYAPLFFDALMQVRLCSAVTMDVDAVAFSNIMANARAISKSLDLTSLWHAFEGVPAVIVGAGPSLSSVLPALERLSGQALVLAGGAALAALAGTCAKCHITAGIDKDPNHDLFLHGQVFEAPFFYQERFSSQQLAMVSAEKYLLPANEGFKVEQWLFEERSQSYSSGDSGWTVSTCLVALATYFGCNPIILAGVDLHAEHPQYAEQVPSRYFLVKKKEDWILASQWLDQWIEMHPSTTFIRPHAASKTLDTLYPCYDLWGMVHARLAGGTFSDVAKQSKNAVESLLASMERALELVEKMLVLAAKAEKGEKNSSYFLFDYDLSQELAYDLILEPSWKGVAHVLTADEEHTIPTSMKKLLWFREILQRYRDVTK